MKIHYLNGLALIANEDSEREKADSYLASVNHSFGFTPDMIDVFKDFATNPDEQAILDMIQAFETKDIKYNFIIDAMMIAGIDENFCDNKKAVVAEYCEMLKITKKETKDLEYIYEMFYIQDARALSRYFNRNKTIKQSLFIYLLEYYKIDLAYALKEEENELLTFKWFKPTFEKGGLKNASEIMKNPISNAQFLIYLNAKYDENTILVDENKVYLNDEEKTLLMELENSDIGFNNSGFYIEDSTKDDEKITGITADSVKGFVEWINDLKGLEYNIVEFFRTEDDKIDIKDLKTVWTGKEFCIYKSKIEREYDIEFLNIPSRLKILVNRKTCNLNEFSFRLMR